MILADSGSISAIGSSLYKPAGRPDIDVAQPWRARYSTRLRSHDEIAKIAGIAKIGN
jgi:hypothetical protein